MGLRGRRLEQLSYPFVTIVKLGDSTLAVSLSGFSNFQAPYAVPPTVHMASLHADPTTGYIIYPLGTLEGMPLNRINFIGFSSFKTLTLSFDASCLLPLVVPNPLGVPVFSVFSASNALSVFSLRVNGSSISPLSFANSTNFQINYNGLSVSALQPLGFLNQTFDLTLLRLNTLALYCPVLAPKATSWSVTLQATLVSPIGGPFPNSTFSNDTNSTSEPPTPYVYITNYQGSTHDFQVFNFGSLAKGPSTLYNYSLSDLAVQFNWVQFDWNAGFDTNGPVNSQVFTKFTDISVAVFTFDQNCLLPIVSVNSSQFFPIIRVIQTPDQLAFTVNGDIWGPQLYWASQSNLSIQFPNNSTLDAQAKGFFSRSVNIALDNVRSIHLFCPLLVDPSLGWTVTIDLVKTNSDGSHLPLIIGLSVGLGVLFLIVVGLVTLFIIYCCQQSKSAAQSPVPILKTRSELSTQTPPVAEHLELASWPRLHPNDFYPEFSDGRRTPNQSFRHIASAYAVPKDKAEARQAESERHERSESLEELPTYNFAFR